MNKIMKKVIAFLFITVLCLNCTSTNAKAYTLTTKREYAYTKLGAKAFSIQATGTYDFPSRYNYNIKLGAAKSDPTIYNLSNITYSIDYSYAGWNQSTLGNFQRSELFGEVKAYWGVFSGTGFGIFKWVPCEKTCSASITTRIQ